MATFAPSQVYLSQQQQQPQPSSLNDSPCMTAASVINHRVFVGSLQVEVNEEILKKVFERVEPTLAIRDTKIVRESNGQSKGYGFVTYASEEDAQKVIKKHPGAFTYKGRPWNIAPAVRRYAPHTPDLVYVPFSPSLYPHGVVGYLPQQVYPSPFVTSPMNESQFVFPPLPSAQQQSQQVYSSQFVTSPMDESQFVFSPLPSAQHQSQQVYSSPFITSSMNESQFAFPPLSSAQQQ